jgi:hypothetical protein
MSQSKVSRAPRPRHSRERRRRALAALLCAALAAPSATAAGRPGAESPAALVARLNAAVAADDFPEVAACIAPDERAQLAVAMVAMTGMMVGFMEMGGELAEGVAAGMAGEELTAERQAELAQQRAEMEAKAAGVGKRYDAILAKHGLKERLGEGAPEPPAGMAPGAAARQLLAGADEIALLRDLLALLEELGEGRPRPGSLSMTRGEVTDLEVEGDRGTARSGEETVELVKIDGRWYLKPAMGGR